VVVVVVVVVVVFLDSMIGGESSLLGRHPSLYEVLTRSAVVSAGASGDMLFMLGDLAKWYE